MKKKIFSFFVWTPILFCLLFVSLSSPLSLISPVPSSLVGRNWREQKGMALMETIIGYIVLIMFLFFLLIVFIVFKPWRFLVRCSPTCTIEADDLESPFIEEDFGEQPSHTYASPEVFAPEGCLLNDGLLNSSGAHGLGNKQRASASASHLTQGCSLLLDISHPSKNVLVGQTLKRHFEASLSAEEQQRHLKGYADSRFPLEDTTRQPDFSKNIGDQGSCLTLEVITGPSRGLSYSLRSSSTAELPFTLGRNSPCDLVLKDSEVSGKHALIKWNLNKLNWELVDMGSLNGTLLNSKPVHHPAYGSRHWGDPVELSSGDIITLGTTSQIHVHIELVAESGAPFCIGIASDAMALRYGGKKLPMEDVLYYRWPLHGVNQFGVFGICDGHGGADAAKSASQILPDMITNILSDSFKREKVLSQKDASDVLRQAFDLTEASMNNYYEGCTATVLMVWAAGDRSFFVQCANVGDSTCIISIDGRQIMMTEDHRITSYAERQRINESGELLKDGDTRLCGLNLGRMLGDKFLKEQDPRFISKPYISEVVTIGHMREAFALLASDGFWDVISVKKAMQLVLQAREKFVAGSNGSAEKIANLLLNEARTLRTKDNTSIVYLDFDTAPGNSCTFGY
ncbi:hypothetical protein Droror1_Dr00012586 [Drosera rotundifolia]